MDPLLWWEWHIDGGNQRAALRNRRCPQVRTSSAKSCRSLSRSSYLFRRIPRSAFAYRGSWEKVIKRGELLNIDVSGRPGRLVGTDRGYKARMLLSVSGRRTVFIKSSRKTTSIITTFSVSSAGRMAVFFRIPSAVMTGDPHFCKAGARTRSKMRSARRCFCSGVFSSTHGSGQKIPASR